MAVRLLALTYFVKVGTGWTGAANGNCAGAGAAACTFSDGCNVNFGNSGAKNTYCLTGTTDTGNAEATDTTQRTDNHEITILEWEKKIGFLCLEI